jgi:VWFA-related protein
MRTLCFALATAILWLLPSALVEGQDGPTFSANSELVVLHVTVRDKKGAYVTGLTKDAFSVIEDGQAQTVSLFTDTDTPATIGLLIDVVRASEAPGRRDLRDCVQRKRHARAADRLTIHE